jgi:hypothetical protein
MDHVTEDDVLYGQAMLYGLRRVGEPVTPNR